MASGVLRIDHRAPLQLSVPTTVLVEGQPSLGQSVSVVDDPTAVHALADAQDTLFSPLTIEYVKFELLGGGIGLAVLSIDQFAPFQRSASVAPANDSTAVQTFLDVQDTPLRTPALGVRCINHREPFQRSTRGPRLLANPTAVQSGADEHDTPLSELLLAPAGVGISQVPGRGVRHRRSSRR